VPRVIWFIMTWPNSLCTALPNLTHITLQHTHLLLLDSNIYRILERFLQHRYNHINIILSNSSVMAMLSTFCQAFAIIHFKCILTSTSMITVSTYLVVPYFLSHNYANVYSKTASYNTDITVTRRTLDIPWQRTNQALG